jgi:hypothetical protein
MVLAIVAIASLGLLHSLTHLALSPTSPSAAVSYEPPRSFRLVPTPTAVQP